MEYAVSFVFSTGLNLAAGARVVYLYFEDLYMYYYDEVEHEGLIS